jgi:hypothetical protein
MGGSSANFSYDTSGNYAWAVASNELQAWTAGTKRMVIDASGNVGVGATPSAWGSTPKAVQFPYGCAIANLGAGDVVVTQNAYFDNPNFKYASTTGVGSSVYRQIDGTHRWSYSASGTAGNNITFTEAMRIDSSGNLLVGATSTGYTDSRLVLSLDNSTKWVTGPGAGIATRFYVSASSSGGVYLNGTSATSWTAISDERFKSELLPIENATEKVVSLRAVTGVLTLDESKTRKAFLMAQDVLAVLPEAVDTTNPEQLGLAYTDVIPLLVAAIQEQQALITQLQADVAALKGASA